MDIVALATIIIFVPSNLLLSLVIYQNSPKNWTNRLFSLLIVFLTLYLGFNTFLNSAVLSFEMKLLFSRIIISLGAIINLFAFLFLYTFPDVEISIKKSYKLVLSLITIGLFIAGFTPLIFSTIEIVNNVATPKPGPLMPVFLLHTLLLIGGGIYAIVAKFRKSVGIQREKIGYVLLSFFIFFTCVVLFNFIFAVFFSFGNLVPFLPLYLLIFNIIVGYAIVKKRLMEIRVLVARSVVYVLLVILTAAVYGSLLFFLGRLVSNVNYSANSLLVSIVLAVVLALSFQSIKQFLAKSTDKLLYKDFYDSEDLLYQLTVIMASTLLLEDLARAVLNKTLQTMKISKGMIILTEGKEIYQVLSEGYTELPTIDEVDIHQLISSSELLIYDQLPEGDLKRILKKYKFDLVAQFVHEGKQLGVLAFGEKLSGESYLDKDARLLSIFVTEAAVAFQNAKSYEEIRRFNITLKDEVTQATRELVAANEKLLELDALKDEFVSIASHELRTPMVSIKNYLWMTLAGKGGKITRKQKFYLERAYESSNRMTKLVNDMLNISRIESGRIILNVQKVDIHELASTLTEDLQQKAKQLSIHLDVIKEAVLVGTKKPVALPNVIADPDKISEVIVNFLSNALKFTPEKGHITISFEVDEPEELVQVNVTDTGVGLTKEQIPKLFKKFGMLKESYSSITDAAQGTGLGLYISKSVVQLHGGKIGVTSEGKDKGSTFSFSVPIFNQEKMAKMQKKFESGTDAGLIRTAAVTEEVDEK